VLNLPSELRAKEPTPDDDEEVATEPPFEVANRSLVLLGTAERSVEVGSVELVGAAVCQAIMYGLARRNATSLFKLFRSEAMTTSPEVIVTGVVHETEPETGVLINSP
jgi:hypothetical protein